jgi:hypothetical protein
LINVFGWGLKTLNCKGIRPCGSQPGNGVLLKLRIRDLQALGCLHQVGRKSILDIICNDALHCGYERSAVSSLRESGHPIPQACMGEDARAEIKEKGLAVRNQSIEVASLACQDIGQDLTGRAIRVTITR